MAHDDNAVNYFVLFDELEWLESNGSGAFSWNNKSWVGRDLDRVWIRSEGERAGGGLEHAEVQVFYGRAVRRWWDVGAGVRQDVGPGTNRTWAGVGVQGLAPYIGVTPLGGGCLPGHTFPAAELPQDDTLGARPAAARGLAIVHERDEAGLERSQLAHLAAHRLEVPGGEISRRHAGTSWILYE